MASLTPTRFNNYRATSTTKLNADVWNASVGDLAARMKDVEAKATGYDQIVSAGIGVALDRINLALTPAVTQVQAIIDQTNTYLLQLQGNSISASLVVTSSTRRFVTDDQLTSIGSVSDLATRIAALEARTKTTSSKAFFMSTM